MSQCDIDVNQETRFQAGWRHEWKRAPSGTKIRAVVPGPFKEPLPLVQHTPFYYVEQTKSQSRNHHLRTDCSSPGMVLERRPSFEGKGIPDPWAEYLTFHGTPPVSNKISALDTNYWSEWLDLTETTWKKHGISFTQGIPDPWESRPSGRWRERGDNEYPCSGNNELPLDPCPCPNDTIGNRSQRREQTIEPIPEVEPELADPKQNPKKKKNLFSCFKRKLRKKSSQRDQKTKSSIKTQLVLSTNCACSQTNPKPALANICGCREIRPQQKPIQAFAMEEIKCPCSGRRDIQSLHTHCACLKRQSQPLPVVEHVSRGMHCECEKNSQPKYEVAKPSPENCCRCSLNKFQPQPVEAKKSPRVITKLSPPIEAKPSPEMCCECSLKKSQPQPVEAKKSPRVVTKLSPPIEAKPSPEMCCECSLKKSQPQHVVAKTSPQRVASPSPEECCECSEKQPQRPPVKENRFVEKRCTNTDLKCKYETSEESECEETTFKSAPRKCRKGPVMESKPPSTGCKRSQRKGQPRPKLEAKQPPEQSNHCSGMDVKCKPQKPSQQLVECKKNPAKTLVCSASPPKQALVGIKRVPVNEAACPNFCDLSSCQSSFTPKQSPVKIKRASVNEVACPNFCDLSSCQSSFGPPEQLVQPLETMCTAIQCDSLLCLQGELVIESTLPTSYTDDDLDAENDWFEQLCTSCKDKFEDPDAENGECKRIEKRKRKTSLAQQCAPNVRGGAIIEMVETPNYKDQNKAAANRSMEEKENIDNTASTNNAPKRRGRMGGANEPPKHEDQNGSDAEGQTFSAGNQTTHEEGNFAYSTSANVGKRGGSGEIMINQAHDFEGPSRHVSITLPNNGIPRRSTSEEDANNGGRRPQCICGPRRTSSGNISDISAASTINGSESVTSSTFLSRLNTTHGASSEELKTVLLTSDTEYEVQIAEVDLSDSQVAQEISIRSNRERRCSQKSFDANSTFFQNGPVMYNEKYGGDSPKAGKTQTNQRKPEGQNVHLNNNFQEDTIWPTSYDSNSSLNTLKKGTGVDPLDEVLEMRPNDPDDSVPHPSDSQPYENSQLDSARSPPHNSSGSLSSRRKSSNLGTIVNQDPSASFYGNDRLASTMSEANASAASTEELEQDLSNSVTPPRSKRSKPRRKKSTEPVKHLTVLESRYSRHCYACQNMLEGDEGQKSVVSESDSKKRASSANSKNSAQNKRQDEKKKKLSPKSKPNDRVEKSEDGMSADDDATVISVSTFTANRVSVNPKPGSRRTPSSKASEDRKRVQVHEKINANPKHYGDKKNDQASRGKRKDKDAISNSEHNNMSSGRRYSGRDSSRDNDNIGRGRQSGNVGRDYGNAVGVAAGSAPRHSKEHKRSSGNDTCNKRCCNAAPSYTFSVNPWLASSNDNQEPFSEHEYFNVNNSAPRFLNVTPINYEPSANCACSQKSAIDQTKPSYKSL